MPNAFAAEPPSNDQLYALSRPFAGAAGHGLWHADASATFGKVTPSAGMTIAIASIAAAAGICNGTANAAYAGGTLALTAQHATLYRRDIVHVNAAGTVAATSGANAVSAAVCDAPSIAVGNLALADVLIKPTSAGGGTVASGDITDKRQQLAGARHVVKVTDQSNTTTTLANDNALLFSIGPSENWIYRIILNCALPITSVTGFKYTLTVPAGATIQTYGEVRNAPGTSVYSAQGTGTVSFTTVGFSFNAVIIEGWVINSSTAGTVTLQWASQGAGTSTVYGQNAGLTSSFLQALRMG